MKRVFIPLVFLLASALIISACSNNSATTASTATAPSASSAKPASSTPGTAASNTSSAQSTAIPQSGGTLKIIVATDIGTLGAPAEAIAGMYARVAQPAMEFLLKYNAQMKLQPRLIDSWDISPDGKTFTLHLHKGIKFQDGTDFNADAVKYNLQNYAPNKIVPAALKNISSYDLVDDYTLQLNLNAFDSSLLYELSGSNDGLMASPTAMKIPSTPDNLAKDHMVGTGPFKFVSYQQGLNIKYTRWDGYWQTGKPYLDGVEFVQIPDPVTSLISFKKGEAQVIFKITPKDARDLEKAGFDVILTDTRPVYYITPDGANSNSPWSNKNVRMALEYALDKNALASSIGEGYYETAYQMASTQDITYLPGLAPRTYDPVKAKQLLKDGGYPNGFKTTIYAGTSYSPDVLVAVQAYLKAVGIDADIQLCDSARFTSLQNAGWKNGLVFPGAGLQPGDIANIARCFATTGTGISFQASVSKPSGWQDKLDATFAQVDDAKRLALQKEVTQTMYDSEMVIPLWATPIISAESKNVHDFQFSKGGLPHMYEIQNAWLSQ